MKFGGSNKFAQNKPARSGQIADTVSERKLVHSQTLPIGVAVLSFIYVNLKV